MDRPVTIQKDMLANSWAGTFHKRTTNLTMTFSSDSTHDENNNCGLALPLLKSNSWRTTNANTYEAGTNDGNRISDPSIISSCRTKSIKSKKISTSPRSNSDSGTSVLQPNHFTIKSERIARKRMIKTEQSDVNRRLLANMGVGSCDDVDNNAKNIDSDDGDSLPPELGPWGTGSSAADTDDSDVNTDDDNSIVDHTKKRLFTEDISKC
jgi:hypothetical protein